MYTTHERTVNIKLNNNNIAESTDLTDVRYFFGNSQHFLVGYYYQNDKSSITPFYDLS